MVLHSLTNQTHTKWGMPYSRINWSPDWYTFLKLQDKEIRELGINHRKYIAFIIYWFDTKILQEIGVAKDDTLWVRMRIVTCFVNKLPHTYASWYMRHAFIRCMIDTYQKFMHEWNEYYCRYVLGLPF